LSSLTLSLTIGQASSIEGEVLVQLSAALLATRLVDVSSTQCARNLLGFLTFHQINSRSSFIKPRHSRTSIVAFRRTPRYSKNTTTKELVDYRVFAPKELSSRPHVPSNFLFITAYHLFCHDRTGTPPYEFAGPLQLNPRRLKNPLRLSPGH
jgi:hypothetical protein